MHNRKPLFLNICSFHFRFFPSEPQDFILSFPDWFSASCLSSPGVLFFRKTQEDIIMENTCLEVCVDSFDSAMAAIQGGANRLELCSCLMAGGLTPEVELLEQIRSKSDIAIRCLMRPRAGDFLYTREEIRMLAAQIENLRSYGADGFVIGCLTSQGNLDKEAMMPLIEAADGAALTLHRCIDVSRDPIETYLQAARLGFDTVLTSGAAANCISGIETLRRLLLLQNSHKGPEVLIGAGVTPRSIRTLLAELPNAHAFHASCKTLVESAMEFRRAEVPMGLPYFDEWHIQQTDEAQVRALRKELDI
jgi:copper homeostasis protein